eukprot:m.51091 g.51091  ORF g.51091 m.51091 type:complete len:907 (-) comp7284_c1_seq1:166-2886(-)
MPRKAEYEPLLTPMVQTEPENAGMTGLEPQNAPFESFIEKGHTVAVATTEGPKGRLTTFFGVFVPCVLSIFSVILFLRLGYVLGQAGLIVSLIMLVVAYAVVFLTVLSISAISTNGVVKGGGAYYMISRSLGPEFGGAIGIVFYFANIFASGLYIIGFVETLIQTAPELDISFGVTYGLRSAVLFLCLIISLVGAGAFAKASFAIFGIVTVAVVAVVVNFLASHEEDNLPPALTSDYNGTLKYTGFSAKTLYENLDVDLQNDYTTNTVPGIPTLFGVLFNGVTGIMAGANMSGDLKDASKSIPRGTMQALTFTFVIYITIFFFTAATCSRELLVHNYGYLQEINRVPQLIMVGVFSATLSAALSCLIGASRILQAISKDNLLGDSFLLFSKERGEPVRAVTLSWMLVQLVLLISTITTIAPIVAMLFLLSYAITNFACFFLTISGTVNFRPRFRLFSWHTALAGGLSCIIIMFVVEPSYAALAILLFLVCFSFIHIRAVAVDWGDVSQALIYHQVRKYLLRLEVQSTKFWRPQVLMMVRNPRSHLNMVLFANDMKKGGLYVLGHVVMGEFNESTREELQRSQMSWMILDRVAKVKAFVDCTIATSLRQGALSLLMTSGLGGMRPNIVCLGWPHEEDEVDQLVAWRNDLEEQKRARLIVKLARVHEADDVMSHFESLPEYRQQRPNPVPTADYVGVLDDAMCLGKNVAVMRNFNRLPANLRAAKAAIKHSEAPWYIDLWPLSINPGSCVQHTYEVIFQMGSVVSLVPRWRYNTKLRVFHIVEKAEELASERTRIRDLLLDLRVDAEIKVVALESNPYEGEETIPSLRMLENMEPSPSARARLQQINGVIQKHSQRTAVMFTHLPSTSNFAGKSEQYLSLLDDLSRDLPPVVMVHGSEKVVTYSIDAV